MKFYIVENERGEILSPFTSKKRAIAYGNEQVNPGESFTVIAMDIDVNADSIVRLLSGDGRYAKSCKSTIYKVKE